MKITKRQLRRIIKEEKAKLQEQTPQMTDSGQRVYDEVETQALAIVEDVLNNYGPWGDSGADDIVIEAIADALKDVANMVVNDDRLAQGY